MNQITVESNVVEIKTTEQVLADKQIEETIAELNSSQLALIGGGTVILIL